MSVFIVAEAGINHLGDRIKMLALCEAAKHAGADAVKFQAYNTPQLLTHRGQDGTKPCGLPPDPSLSLYELLRKCELSDADLDAIAAHCNAIGLKWFCSVFDPGQVARVLSRGACCLKIGHAEADWIELHDACLAAPDEIKTYVSSPPGNRDYERMRPVHCIKEYPATSPPRLSVLRGYLSPVGFSSHYQDYRVPAAATLRGAEYIEAHLMLNERNAGLHEEPEAAWSLSPRLFGDMVRLIREYESWL